MDRLKVMMNTAKLASFCRPGLDVLFVALNPPVQSNEHGHWFSGRGSRFFDSLHRSGLITEQVAKATADDLVFGSTSVNYKRCEYGALDLVGDLVETNSRKVRTTREHVDALVNRVCSCEPRFVCIIHSKVRDAMNRYAALARSLEYGMCGSVLARCKTVFFLNYFPNGNNIADERKLEIYRSLRDLL